MPRPRDRSHGGASRIARLEALVEEHHEAVLRYVSRRAPRDNVDDVLADTFLVAWRRLDDVPENARPWLMGVARNVIATQARGARRREALALRLWSSHEPACAAIEEPESRVGVALEELSERDREAVILVFVEELTPAEAAQVLGQLPSTFRARLHRAKRRLKRAVEDDALGDRAAWPSDMRETTS